MPLLDHFHAPLSELRHWESFHARWATTIADALEEDLLPPGYFAEVQVHLGSRIEIDIATFEENASETAQGTGTTATAVEAPRLWAPPAPHFTMPATSVDRIEVLVFESEAGATLVAAVELVSPRNKDRAESRRAFAAKCAAYLQSGVGLVVVDVVTSRRANLHNVLVELLDLPAACRVAEQALAAMAYRPVQRGEERSVEVWHERLAVGEPLPTLPLALDKGQCVRLDLEDVYLRTCRRMRLPEGT